MYLMVQRNSKRTDTVKESEKTKNTGTDKTPYESLHKTSQDDSYTNYTKQWKLQLKVVHRYHHKRSKDITFQ